MTPTALQALLDLGALIAQSGGAFYGLAVAAAAVTATCTRNAARRRAAFKALQMLLNRQPPTT